MTTLWENDVYESREHASLGFCVFVRGRFDGVVARCGIGQRASWMGVIRLVRELQDNAEDGLALLNLGWQLGLD